MPRKPRSNIANAERLLEILNDPQAVSFTYQTVECGECRRNITLDDRGGELNLMRWHRHKATCTKYVFCLIISCCPRSCFLVGFFFQGRERPTCLHPITRSPRKSLCVQVKSALATLMIATSDHTNVLELRVRGVGYQCCSNFSSVVLVNLPQLNKQRYTCFGEELSALTTQVTFVICSSDSGMACNVLCNALYKFSFVGPVFGVKKALRLGNCRTAFGQGGQLPRPIAIFPPLEKPFNLSLIVYDYASRRR
jgi:hypothetical protein